MDTPQVSTYDEAQVTEYKNRIVELEAQVSVYQLQIAQLQGSLRGQIGGVARREKLSPERRKEIAQKAIQARWAKRPEGQKTKKKKEKLVKPIGFTKDE